MGGKGSKGFGIGTGGRVGLRGSSTASCFKPRLLVFAFALHHPCSLGFPARPTAACVELQGQQRAGVGP